MAGKKETIRELTQSAWSTLLVTYRQEQKGELSRDQAQKEAIGLLRSLRYGPEMKDYFWINDLEGRMIMHPYTRQFEGKDLSGYTDSQGIHVFQKFVDVAREKEAGFVQYMWQWKDDPSLKVPKLSYVKLFKPWGWVVGTGIYIKDAQEEIAALTHKLTLISVGILSCIVALSFYGIWQSSKTESARRITEDSLRKERDFTRNLIDTAPSFVLLLDSHGKIITSNRFTAEHTGYSNEELQNQDWFQLCVPEWARAGAREAFTQAAQGRDVGGYINPIVSHHGDEAYVEWYSTVLRSPNDEFTGVLAIGHDVTERLKANEEKHKLEEQLHHAQKLEAVGQLAGGVAHDFNNLLTVVMGNIELLREAIPAEREACELVDTIKQAADQAAGVTRSLLTFSRKIPVEKKPVNLNQTVDECIRMLRRIIPSTIDVSYHKDHAEPLWVNADNVQLQQVLINLAINARDAMPEGGDLEISLSRLKQLPEDISEEVLDTGRSFVRLEVRDTGMGISPKDMERIFEPFFTTKTWGKGTGLGLSIIHSIVKGHDGHIDVQSQPDHGTSFTVILPRLEMTQKEENTGTLPEAVPVGLGETILLAEDHQFIREMLVAGLQSAGYRVFQTADGKTLLDTYQNNYDKIHLVILDLDLPQRSGQECLREIRKRDGKIPVILISGSVDTEFEGSRNANVHFLRKPFQITEFNAMVSKIIRSYKHTETEL